MLWHCSVVLAWGLLLSAGFSGCDTSLITAPSWISTCYRRETKCVTVHENTAYLGYMLDLPTCHHADGKHITQMAHTLLKWQWAVHVCVSFNKPPSLSCHRQVCHWYCMESHIHKSVIISQCTVDRPPQSNKVHSFQQEYNNL